MKTILLTLFLFVSCGKEYVNTTKKQTVYKYKPNAEQEQKVLELESIVLSLLTLVENSELELAELSQNYSDQQSTIEAIQAQQDAMSILIASNQSRLAELETGLMVVQLIDPCGDSIGQFDEILLKLSDGTIIAYFEHGSKRFLTVVSDGNYRTTDASNCAFSVSNGEVSW